MRRTGVRMWLAGLVLLGLTAMCMHAQASDSDQAWKRLKKMRIRAGVMIGKGRPNYTEAYVHLTDIRAKLEEAGILEPVSILLFADYGTKIPLGTYEPVLSNKEDGSQEVTFPTIPNAFLVKKALSYQVGDLYPFQFLDSSGKVRVTIRIKLMGEMARTF